mmetsp:Transcript_22236/g.33125  ORF Transcript_22236/g.33125 Transcript_22236/m.33125 type:complete len:469 (-) Transcript_22236:279-1685(-)
MKAPSPWRIRIARVLLFLRIKSSSILKISIVIFLCVTLLNQRKSGEEGYRRLDQISRNNVATRENIAQEGGVSDLRMLGYDSKPQSIGYYFSRDNRARGAQRLPRLQRRQTQKTVTIPEGEAKAQLKLLNSRDYYNHAEDPFPPDNCVAQNDWQLKSYPSCSDLHEIGLHDLVRQMKDHNNGNLVGGGNYRDTWLVKDMTGKKLALKTLVYDDDFSKRNEDRHRRDALVSEQMTSYPSVVDIFGYCSNSALYEYGDNSDLEYAIVAQSSDYPDYYSEEEQLTIAVHVAAAIADLHSIDDPNRASVAHADIQLSQFILIDGVYKLTDFNRCRFIGWNELDSKPCGFFVGHNPGHYRAPEEYKYEEETEKIDVFSMGNIFYNIMTKKAPFEELNWKKVPELVINGEHPSMEKSITNSTNAALKAILNATVMAWTYDPQERPSARYIANYLLDELNMIREALLQNSTSALD